MIETIRDEDATSASSNPVTDSLQIQPFMKEKLPRLHQAGTLRLLSESMCASTCTVASTGLYASVYNNINMVFKVVEQVLDRTGKHNCCKV